MMRLRHKLLLHAFRVFDQVLLVISLVAMVGLISEGRSFAFLHKLMENAHRTREILAAGLLVLGWYVVFNLVVHYDANRFTSLSKSMISFSKAAAIAAFHLLIVAETFSIPKISGTVVIAFWLLASLLGMSSRIVLKLVLMVVRKSGLNCRHIVLVGTSEQALALANRIDVRPELGYRIEGFFAEDSSAEGKPWSNRWPLCGKASGIKAFLEEGTVDEVLICLSLRENFKIIYEIMQACRDLGVVVRVVPFETDMSALRRLQLEQFEGAYVLTFFRENLLWQLLIKRAMDVVLSFIVLLVLSPLMIAVALIIKLTSPGPVFFVQERVGMNKRKFRLLKFRSMVVDAEAKKAALADQNEMEGPAFKIKNDPRVTPVGRFIRRTSIDELPQLINVIKGEMALVGPRPPLFNEVDKYEWLHRKRLCIKPGITCIWQVSGRNNLSFEQWMELDKYYVDNWSIWLDVKILFKTVPAVLFGRGAS